MTCPICLSLIQPIESLQFDASKRVEYVRCDRCGFIFCPEIYSWTPQQFGDYIYNDDYVAVDPDYIITRPAKNAKLLFDSFRRDKTGIRHLDYGGGDGLLADILVRYGFNSTSWDPYTSNQSMPDTNFNLITAFEVFEHVPDVNNLMKNLVDLLDDTGVVFFTTFLSDDQFANLHDWWYAAPRQGHISLFSASSLTLLAQKFNLNSHSFSNQCHVFYKALPAFFQI